MRIVKNQDGFSLAEVIIAAGIMGAIAVGGMRLMSNQAKSSKTVESRFEYGSILNDIRQTLGEKESCTETFLGKNADSLPEGDVTAMKQVLNPGATPTVISKYESNLNPTLARRYGNSGVIILSYRLSSTDTDPAIGIPAVPGNVGATNLIIKFSSVGETFGAKKLERKVKLNVEVDPATHNIVSCSSTGSMADLDDKYVNAAGDTMTGNLLMGDPSVPAVANIWMMGDSEIDFQSDERLKYKIKDIRTLNNLRKIRPVHYLWRSSDSPSYGVIAQELEKIYPDLVKKGPDDYLAVNYTQLIPIMLRALQEVDDENQKLKSEIKELRKKQNNLSIAVEQMKRDICSKDPKSTSCN